MRWLLRLALIGLVLTLPIGCKDEGAKDSSGPSPKDKPGKPPAPPPPPPPPRG